MKIKYPKDEIVWCSYYSKSGDMKFIMTSKPQRDFYFLYEIEGDNTLRKLGRAKTPKELEKKHKVDKECST